MQRARVAVECMECGKRFRTASMDPQCPKCHGVDIDVDYGAPSVRRADPVASVATRPSRYQCSTGRGDVMRAYRCRGCGIRVVKASPIGSAFERCNECWDGVLVAVVTCGRCRGVIGLRGSRQDAGLYTDPDTLLAEPCPTCLMHAAASHDEAGIVAHGPVAS